MLQPLKLWQSEEVKNLLLDFYALNAKKANMPVELAQSIITDGWKLKSVISEADLKTKLNEYFANAFKSSDYRSNETSVFELINFKSVDTFLDIGANNLGTLNAIGSNQPHIKKLIGIDIIPKANEFRFPEKSEYFQVDEHATFFPIAESSVDLINIKFVLHHFPDEESIVRILNNASKALKPKGRLLLWEETFESKNVDLESLVGSNNKLGIKTNLELTKRFYDLTDQQKWEFIIVNDWIINVKQSHMPWTGLYKTWENWIELLENQGFTLERYFNLGLRVNGLLKQGVHMVGEFRK